MGFVAHLKVQETHNDAVVAFCCLYVELILQQEPRRLHRIGKATEYLRITSSMCIYVWEKQ